MIYTEESKKRYDTCKHKEKSYFLKLRYERYKKFVEKKEQYQQGMQK